MRIASGLFGVCVAVLVAVTATACNPNDTNGSPPLDPIPSQQVPPYSSQPAPPTVDTPTQPRLPNPYDEVRGGGPLSGDPEAVARMDAQLPEIPQDIQLKGADALAYSTRVASLIPGLSATFTSISKVADCGTQYGVIGGKAYITPDFRAAGIMVVLSHNQLQQLPEIALKCFVNDVIGGGGPVDSGFTPCVRKYYYDRTTNDVADRYFVIVAGTNTASCDLLVSSHGQYSPHTF